MSWTAVSYTHLESMSKLSQEEVQSLRSRICHGEQGLISTLTPEQFLALLSYDYDTGFAAGKASAQKEILCMLAADGMPPEKIALLLRMEAETCLLYTSCRGRGQPSYRSPPSTTG